MAMIETMLDNLEAIAVPPNLTGVYIGPRVSRWGTQAGPRRAGGCRQDHPHSRDRARRRHRGIHCMSPTWWKMVKEGMDLVTIASDMRILAAGYASMFSELGLIKWVCALKAIPYTSITRALRS